jgi:squalene synthase HpnC
VEDRSSQTPSADGGRRPAPVGLPSEADVLGRAAGENFPVALRILPGQLRRDLLALYGFARLTDQLGDAYAGDRLAALDWLDAEVERSLLDGGGHPLVARIARTVRQRGLDPAPLHQLIAANRQDQSVPRYATFDELLAYCRLSADPVGRLVLGIFGYADEHRVAWSDAICSALQLAEHWGDVVEDAAAGRIYLPTEDLDHFGVTEAEVTGPGPARPALRALMAFEADRARRLLDQGAPLVGALDGWARLAISGFAGGGYAALDALAARGFDPLDGTPRRSAVRIAGQSWVSWRGRGGGAR